MKVPLLKRISDKDIFEKKHNGPQLIEEESQNNNNIVYQSVKFSINEENWEIWNTLSEQLRKKLC